MNRHPEIPQPAARRPHSPPFRLALPHPNRHRNLHSPVAWLVFSWDSLGRTAGYPGAAQMTIFSLNHSFFGRSTHAASSASLFAGYELEAYLQQRSGERGIDRGRSR
jgi:hypothetical protein